MGAGFSVDFTGREDIARQRAADRDYWQGEAVEQAQSILARQTEAPRELVDAWGHVERLASAAGGKNVYSLGDIVVMSACKPEQATFDRATLFSMALNSTTAPVISYHFDLFPGADTVLPRYVLEQVKNPTPQDGTLRTLPRNMAEFFEATLPWVRMLEDRAWSGSPRVSIPSSGVVLPPLWFSAYLLSKGLHPIEPGALPKDTEPLSPRDGAIKSIAQHAVYAEVAYMGPTVLGGNTTYIARVANPRYGAWAGYPISVRNEVCDALGEHPSSHGRARIGRKPSRTKEYPGLMLDRELSLLGEALPWESPEERILVDFESPAGRIVMEVARKHTAGPIAEAREQQIQDARRMTAFTQAILPADAP